MRIIVLFLIIAVGSCCNVGADCEITETVKLESGTQNKLFLEYSTVNIFEVGKVRDIKSDYIVRVDYNSLPQTLYPIIQHV